MAPCIFDGPIDGATFRAWVDQQLLETIGPGDIVVMDNLGSHKAIKIGRPSALEARQTLVPPPYSPDLNPIEQAFSKIKHWMRKAQRRSAEDTWRHVGYLVQFIAPQECANYLEKAGYASNHAWNALDACRERDQGGS